jgi:GTP-binding protein
VTLLDYSSYVGAIGIGRIKRGTLKRGMAVTVVNREGKQRPRESPRSWAFTA